MDTPDSGEQRRAANARRDGFSIGLAVGVVGVAFGVLARATGLSVAKTCAMSLLVFTGASQFAAVGVIGAGGTGLAALGSALLLASRNTLYGPVVAQWFGRDPLPRRAVLAQLIIDESTGIGSAQPDHASRRVGFIAGGLGVYIFWNLGTLAGALLGDVVGSVEAWGLDAAFPAAFVALLWPHLEHRPGRVAALVGGVITLVTVPVLPVGVHLGSVADAVLRVGVPILLASLGAAAAAFGERTP